uniref:Uncharacterized protein n=1 Tax=Rhizophagus irregularis (strain DAOM 181602 / DAOM 197198 / MUCL 43194) TaxID=747089 RepID=U9U5V2_RHIID
MSSFIRIDDYESYEKPNNGFTSLNQHSNKRVPDKVSAPNDIISHVPSTPFCTSTSKIPSTHISSSHSPDIIPKEPIYTATGDFIIPGSREWFTHMYRLDCARKAAPPSPVLSLDERRNLLQKEADHIGDSIIEKEKQAEDNSKFQLRLHQEMTAFNDTFNLGKRIAVVTPETKDELYIPYQYGGFYIDNPSQEDSKCVTSDDSKEIERRPYKRLTTSQFAPLPVNNHIDRLKRRRNIPADTVDSSEAGPSGSSTNN